MSRSKNLLDLHAPGCKKFRKNHMIFYDGMALSKLRIYASPKTAMKALIKYIERYDYSSRPGPKATEVQRINYENCVKDELEELISSGILEIREI